MVLGSAAEIWAVDAQTILPLALHGPLQKGFKVLLKCTRKNLGEFFRGRSCIRTEGRDTWNVGQVGKNQEFLRKEKVGEGALSLL